MTRFCMALLLAIVSTGCIDDDESTVDAAGAYADCGCGDRPIDTPDATNPCDACGAGTICVQLLNGTCGSQAVECKPIVTGCEQPVCSQACDAAYCDRQFSTCSAAGCAADLPGAFHCYGV